MICVRPSQDSGVDLNYEPELCSNRDIVSIEVFKMSLLTFNVTKNSVQRLIMGLRME